jgi:hypothetical protein
VQRGLLLIPATSIRPAVLGGVLRVRRWRPVLAASIGLTVLGGALWVLVSLEIWVDTDMVTPRHEVSLVVAAGTSAVIAAICWAVESRQRADRERNLILLKTLAAAASPQIPVQGQPAALRAVPPR